jgi:hypothetical protein
MSLLTSFIIPELEKELIEVEPIIASFLVKKIKAEASELLQWIESKAHLELKGADDEA